MVSAAEWDSTGFDARSRTASSGAAWDAIVGQYEALSAFLYGTTSDSAYAA
jgi:hypothetical protein